MSREIMASILKEMKANPIMRGEAMSGVTPVVYEDFEGLNDKVVVPTGFVDLDYTLLGGAGGFPLGRMVEIYGLESSGKSTIAVRTLAQAQKMGLPCGLFDTELVYGDAFSKSWLMNQGVDPSMLLYVKECIAERVLGAVHAFIEAGGKVAVIDSIAASLASDQSIKSRLEARQKGGYQDRTVGAQARVWTDGIKNLNPIVSDNNALLICTNQVRQRISGYNPAGAVVYHTPGGQGIKHHFSIRLKVDRVKPIMENGKQVGIWSKCVVKKNKVTNTDGWETMKQTLTHLPIYYDGRTVDAMESLLPIAVERGIITRKGPRTYTYKELEAVGKEKFIELLKESGLQDEIRDAIAGTFHEATIDYLLEGDG